MKVPEVQSDPTTSPEPYNIRFINLEDIRDKFKYKHLTSFEADTFQWAERENYYNIVDTSINHSIWQSEQSYSPWLDYTGRNYYFSIQKPSDSLQAITVLKEEESCCSIIYYLIYNKHGRLIDKFQAAGTGADGGWYYSSWGKFINDSIYRLVTVNNDLVGIDSLTQKEIIESDSSLFEYHIGKSGKVTEKKLEEFKREIK